MVPVGVAIITVLFGNSLLEALGEAYSVFLYFVVILAVEIDTIFTLRKDMRGLERSSGGALPVVVAVTLWILFVVSSAITGNSPTSLPYSLIIIAGLGFFASYWVMKTHRKGTIEQYEQERNIAGETKENEKKEFDRLKKEPKNPRVGKRKLDVGK